MLNSVYGVLLLALTVNGAPQSAPAGGSSPPPPAKAPGGNGFVMSLLSSVVGGINIMPGSTQTPDSFILWNPQNSGSGTFPAKAFNDSSLPKRTIYAPINVTQDKLPVILWGNGGCLTVGTMFSEFLKEIASHGFMVIANGPLVELPSIPKGQLKGDYKKNPLAALVRSAPPESTGAIGAFAAGMSRYTWQIESADWAQKGAAGGKYGVPDMDKVAVAGQSCGGQEAYSVTAKDPRIKATALFNSGTLTGSREPLRSFKNSVGIFNGGPVDLAYSNGEKDWEYFPPTLPVVKANIDTGHLGTYFAENGGEDGKIAVAFFKATLKGDAEAKKMFAADGVFPKGAWNVSTRNWL